LSEVKSIELSKRGKFLLLFPILLFAVSFLLTEPYIGLIGISLLSLFLYARYEIGESSIEVKDKIPKENKTVDESFEIEHVIKSDKNLPILLSLQTRKDLELDKDDIKKEKMLTNSSVSYSLVPKSRGYQNVGKLSVSIFDTLELYKKSIEHQINEVVRVNSSPEAVKKAKKYARRGETTEMRRSSIEFRMKSNEFEGIRRYQPGDSLRDIHWKSLSKFQTLMTKQYEKLAPVGAQIFLDCSPSMRRRTSEKTTKLEQGIYVSLEILKNFEMFGHDIGMTAYDHKDVRFHQAPSSESIAFRSLYEKVTDLPGPVDSDEISLERYQDSEYLSSLNEEEKRFSKKLSEFVSGIKQDQIAGVLSAVNQMKSVGEKKKLIIIISDLEMNPQATLKAVEHLKEMQHIVWLLVPFSPWYEILEVDENVLEKTYKEYEKLEKIIYRLKKLDVSIFELHPEKEGVMILEDWEEKKT